MENKKFSIQSYSWYCLLETNKHLYQTDLSNVNNSIKLGYYSLIVNNCILIVEGATRLVLNDILKNRNSIKPQVLKEKLKKAYDISSWSILTTMIDNEIEILDSLGEKWTFEKLLNTTTLFYDEQLSDNTYDDINKIMKLRNPTFHSNECFVSFDFITREPNFDINENKNGKIFEDIYNWFGKLGLIEHNLKGNNDFNNFNFYNASIANFCIKKVELFIERFTYDRYLQNFIINEKNEKIFLNPIYSIDNRNFHLFTENLIEKQKIQKYYKHRKC